MKEMVHVRRYLRRRLKYLKHSTDRERVVVKSLKKGRTITGAQLGPQVWCSTLKYTSKYQDGPAPFDLTEFVPASGVGPKPLRGGLWTSSFVPEGKFCSDWHRWTSEEKYMTFKLKDCWMVTADANARIYEISSLKDLLWLVKNYSVPEPRFYSGKDVLDEYDLDWEKVAKDFDAVHLTRAGRINTQDTKPGFHRWDVESVVWLNDKHITARQFTENEADSSCRVRLIDPTFPTFK